MLNVTSDERISYTTIVKMFYSCIWTEEEKKQQIQFVTLFKDVIMITIILLKRRINGFECRLNVNFVPTRDILYGMDVLHIRGIIVFVLIAATKKYYSMSMTRALEWNWFHCWLLVSLFNHEFFEVIHNLLLWPQYSLMHKLIWRRVTFAQTELNTL